MHVQTRDAFSPVLPQGLEELSDEFPLLAAAVSGRWGVSSPFVPGAGWHRRSMDPRAWMLTAVAAFAAAGDRTQLKIQAARALNAGVRQEELKEIAYATAAHAGVARGLETARTISELFAERWERGEPIN